MPLDDWNAFDVHFEIFFTFIFINYEIIPFHNSTYGHIATYSCIQFSLMPFIVQKQRTPSTLTSGKGQLVAGCFWFIAQTFVQYISCCQIWWRYWLQLLWIWNHSCHHRKPNVCLKCPTYGHLSTWTCSDDIHTSFNTETTLNRTRFLADVRCRRVPNWNVIVWKCFRLIYSVRFVIIRLDHFLSRLYFSSPTLLFDKAQLILHRNYLD